MSYLLDTCVISELASKRPQPDVVQWIDSVDPESVYLSVITIGEIRKGIEKLEASKRKETLQAWLQDELLVRFKDRLAVLDTGVLLEWGTLMGRLEKRGKPMPAVDSLIAATALHRHLILVTRNEDDFLNAGVRLLNPWKK
ncbi:MAG TPA: type II toxin-antitoxin system VapC family toxin [Thermoanaerobaculia bacterium]|nr:type II toxin-antitoxin system VapC family toxin [Thermoanaerobaculia bacterium]